MGFFTFIILLRSQIQPREFEDLRGFIKQFLDQAAPHLEAASTGLHSMEGFYGKKSGASELFTK